MTYTNSILSYEKFPSTKNLMRNNNPIYYFNLTKLIFLLFIGNKFEDAINENNNQVSYRY